MNIADQILSNQDRDGMLRRSLERIIQLYTDKSHFVYELLQNAEDAGAQSIRFVQYPDRLEVMHDGHAFTTENLQGLCDIGQSDKVNNLNQIGEFGVGFKSVFGICDSVRLYSAPTKTMLADNCQPFAVEIRDFTKPVDIDPIPVPATYTTLFVFPYCIGFQFSGFKTIAALNETLSKRLKNLGVTTLLFMHSLSLIEYEIKIPGKELSGQYLLDKQQVNDHCTRVSAIEMENKKTDESMSFIKFSMPIESTSYTRTVDIAFSLVTDKNGRTTFAKAKNPYISVYFPTETESKLDFIVQGPYRTTPNRSSVPADEDENIALAEQTAKLLRQSLLELRDMGMVDLSLMRILPIDEERFDVYPLFQPLYDEVWELLSNEEILPNKTEKGYVKASHALIARSKELVEIFSDDLISELYDDGKHYQWLPVSLTETGPFKNVLSYFSNQLEIEVVRPEDLRSHFNSNRKFLEARKDEWMVQLYRLYETVPNIFSDRNYRNILDAVMIRTASNHIVAPYRKTESGYMPNVFLPPKRTQTEALAGLEIVHPVLYGQCKSFFEDVLHLKVPDEYEFFIKDLEKRYADISKGVPLEKHIQDIKDILAYLKFRDYSSDLKSVLKKSFYLKCRQGTSVVWAHPYYQRILFPQSETGILLDAYYKGINDEIIFIDLDTYQSAGLSYADLQMLGVTDSILTNENETWGEYPSGNPGKQPEWRTNGDFRWKLSVDRIEDVLLFISKNPKAKTSMVKSQTIFKILQQNSSKLVGDVWIGGNKVPNKYGTPAKIVSLLQNEEYNYRLADWDGKWVYTESMQLVSHKSISKHDLSKALYGKVSLDSNLYDLLGFKKGKVDQYEAVVKDYDALPDEKKQSFFAIELERRYGITPEQLNEAYGGNQLTACAPDQLEEDYEFPTGMVKNWDALKKHAAQILSYASPVKYERVVRSIRISRPQDDVRAYLMNMYRVNASYRYACQLCHRPSSNVEMCQLEQKPDVELDPLNLCLCPSCAQKFRMFRNDSTQADRLLDALLDLTEGDITESDHVSIIIKDFDFWFTQTHAAEIIELLRLKDEATQAKKERASFQSDKSPESDSRPVSNSTPSKDVVVTETKAIEDEPAEEAYQSDTVAYQELIGKRIYHRTKKAYAKVIGIEGEYIVLNFETGDKAGKDVKYNFAQCMDNGWIEVVD